jgi:hypothetical protein
MSIVTKGIVGKCFYCTGPHDDTVPVVHWMGGSEDGPIHIWWHARCSLLWMTAFARDVWELKDQGHLGHD